MSDGAGGGPPAPLPGWWEPLRSRAAAARTEDFTGTPPADGGRESAVLVLLGERERDPVGPTSPGDRSGRSGPGDPTGPGVCPDGLQVLLVQRAAGLRTHAGQMAFPGGGVDATDRDAVAAALREAHEEAGVEPDSVTVVGRLPRLWIPVSGYVVTPVLGWWHAPHPVYPRDPVEVADVVRLPVTRLADPANRLWLRHPGGYVGPAFRVDDVLVWGFTGLLLAGVLDLAGWTRPWPADGPGDGAEPAPPTTRPVP